MPLPPTSVARERIHTRRIEIEGFLREDGMLDLDASLVDVKDRDFPLASGLRPAGVPVHLMRVRLTLDRELNIVDAFACSDFVPYPSHCDTIGPAYGALVGLNLVRGFRRTVMEMFGEVRGCSHLTELLHSMPTAAIQTLASLASSTEDGGDGKPFQLDRCHALETSTETVRKYYPKWYRKAGGER